MKRRTLVKQLGTATIATTTLVGSAAADRPTLEVDREIDVSDLEGKVPLVEVLSGADLDALDDRIDPEETMLKVAPDAEILDPSSAERPLCDVMPNCCFTCPWECFTCTCVDCSRDDPETN